MFHYNTSVIKSEENIKYLYINNLSFKIIFRVIEMIKNHFDGKVN
jgi:hypothetical protein